MIKFNKIITKVANDNHERNRLKRLKKADKNHPVIKLFRTKKYKQKNYLKLDVLLDLF